MFANAGSLQEKLNRMKCYMCNPSLYKGMAGDIFYLCDVLQPDQARFPGYEVV